MDYEWIEKFISKTKSDHIKKNRKSMSKGRMWTKKHKRELEVCLKQKTSPRKNYEWIWKTIENKIQSKK